MKTSTTSYQSYILRLWRESGVELAPWRMVLVNPQTGDRRAFTEVEQLSMYLSDQIHAYESQVEKQIRNQGDQNE